MSASHHAADPDDPPAVTAHEPPAVTPHGHAGTGGNEAAPGTGWRTRLALATRAAAPAVLGYALVRLVGLAVLWVFAHRAGADVWTVLSGRLDSFWYKQIVDSGYNSAIPVKPNGTLATTNLAFFPLYPGLIAAVKAVTFLPTAAAGIVVSWLAGLAAAWGIFAVGERVHDRRTGIILAVLWGLVPHAIVQNLAYTETLYTAIAAWTLWAVLRRQWLTAGVLCLLAGLTRPTANALIAVVGLAGLVAVVQRRDGWRPWVAMLLAPLGYLGYLGWVGHRLGRLDGYFYLQREAWGITFDLGRSTVRDIGGVATVSGPLAVYAVTLVIVLCLALLALSVLDRQPWPLWVYSAATVFFVLGAAGSYHSKGRYLMPAFPLLIPVAVALAAARPRTRAVVLVVLLVASSWFGTYLTLVWRYSP